MSNQGQGQGKVQEALALLDASAASKQITVQSDPSDPSRRAYTVPTVDGRRQMVHAQPAIDPLFGERLDLTSMVLRDVPPEPGLLLRLLKAAKDFRRVRLAMLDNHQFQLVVMASFVPDEIHEGASARLLHALREVAAVADSMERQLTSRDLE
ncbi:MAG: hypothetical protein IT370_15215 [Deltaproteobacteria bacterium]|nr:hypothetical protein [Deltaproteobacteria bacterium]